MVAIYFDCDIEKEPFPCFPGMFWRKNSNHQSHIHAQWKIFSRVWRLAVLQPAESGIDEDIDWVQAGQWLGNNADIHFR